MVEKYKAAIKQVQQKQGNVASRLLSLDRKSDGNSKNQALLLKIFSKAFELRQNKSGKYREHAFLLEEMGKQLCKDGEVDGQAVVKAVQILTPPVKTMNDEKLLNALVGQSHDSINAQKDAKNDFRDQDEHNNFQFDDKNNRLGKIYQMRKVDDVLELLIQLSGSATIYDSCQRSDHLSNFSKQYLKKKL